jgi:hypothetical protein
MAGQRVTCIAALGIVLINSAPMRAQGAASNGGARDTPDFWATWWVANADVKGLARERLLVVGPDGNILDAAEGDRSRLELPLRLAPLLGNPASRVRLIHNHPDSNGLSLLDLDLLRLPGVHRIIAIGHDGSAYEAGAGARYNVMPIQQVHAAARRAFDAAVARYGRMLPKRVPIEHRAHLTALILTRAGVIEYSATLGKARSRSWNGNELMLDGVVKWAADAVSQTLLKYR